MSWEIFIDIFPVIATVVSIITAIIIIYYAKVINLQKKQNVDIEGEIAKTKLEAINKEQENKTLIYAETQKITSSIASSISQHLIDDPSWLDNFMDQTGITYRASVYGKRIGHFYYEKNKISQLSVETVVKRIFDSGDNEKFCLLIDSGTTLYPMFQELTKAVHLHKDMLCKKICIVTNNIPGVQYLMKHCKEDPNDDYSEVIIDCFMIPGKPLSVYSAITGAESNRWLSQLKPFLKEWGDESNFKIHVLGFITGNYFSKSTNITSDGRKEFYYYPVARGEGHVEIKQEMAKVSDEVYLISPLMKFSFASVNLLNKVNGFTIPRIDRDEAKKYPRKVMYEEIKIPKNKCHFFTSYRLETSFFHLFSHDLHRDLDMIYGKENVKSIPYDTLSFIPNIKNNPALEFEREIPHDNLREKYIDNTFNIWNQAWVEKHESKDTGTRKELLNMKPHN